MSAGARPGDISGAMERATANARRGELIWEPSAESLDRATITRYMRWLADERGHRFDDYNSLWQWSVTELEGFWASVWDFFEVQASAPYSEVLPERVMPGARWFPGAGGARTPCPGREGESLIPEECTEEVGEAAHLLGGDGAVAVSDASGAARERTGATTKGVRPVGGAGAAVLLVRLPVSAQLVVALALIRIGQDRVRLVGVLELLLGGLVAGVTVRMELARKAPIGLLDLGLGRRLGNAQDLVVVLVLHPTAASAL